MNVAAIYFGNQRVVAQGTVSPVELTSECLARIEKLNPELNAFITVTAESALAQARQAEAEIGGASGVARCMAFRWL